MSLGADALAGFAQVTLSVTRRAAGTLSNGFWTAGAPTVLTRQAVVQPANGRDLAKLPEGQRTRETIKIYSLGDLQTASAPAGGMADLFTYGGATYEVQTVEVWDTHGGFWRALATKVPTS